MNDQQKLAIIACVPVGTPGYTPGPLYAESKCAKCGRAVWLGSMSRAHCDAGHAMAFCMLCAIKLAPRAEAVTINPLAGSRSDPKQLSAAVDFIAKRPTTEHP